MKNDSHVLWYDKPARAWTQALPLGNGTLGAMVYGKTGSEIISLNHDELWSGYPYDKTVEGSADSYRKARELALKGKLPEAQEEIEKHCLGTRSQAYMPLGDLLIEYPRKQKASGYRRSLDLRTGLAEVEYQAGPVKHKRELFASFPGRVIALRMKTSGGREDFTLRFTSPLKNSRQAENGMIMIDGECPSEFNADRKDSNIRYYEEPERRGIRFRAVVRITGNGKITCGKGIITVTSSSDTTVLIACETSFNGFDRQPYTDGKPFEEPVMQTVLSAASFDTLKAAHIADYKDYYNRVHFDVGSDKQEHLPTDKRLKRFEKTGFDRALYALFYNYGRYLAIACSREGSQPSNLQGIWNNQYSPPWHANYTVNINTEMNYWPVLMCSMPELHQPLLKMVGELAEAGRRTAQVHYGAGGFVSHHNVDLWRHTVPVFDSAVYAFWPMSSGWLCRHLFEHYEYTLDKAFLRQHALPVMLSAAEFYLDCLVPDPDGCLIFAPSTSPENTFLYHGKHCSVSQTSTMTMSIIKDLFTNCVMASEILGNEDERIGRIREALPKLLPLRVGSRGQLLEWYDEYEEAEPHHRHISHLYGLHPANLITPETTPELAEAAKTTLELRGDEGTGWSLGWKINFWARLQNGDRALRLLERQLRFVKSVGINYRGGGGTYANLFDAHPPFQIDGNFGSVSGITEMLMQSRDNTVLLLPALPAKWRNGQISGLTAKGGVSVDIVWRSGMLAHARLCGSGDFTVAYRGMTKNIRLRGVEVFLTQEDFKRSGQA